MRSFPAGLLLLVMIPAAGLAQVTGQVLKVGFQNAYRPDCWTPMLVQLTSENTESRKYQIQVIQEDLDSDRPSYVTQDVVVPGRGENQPPAVAEYWVYFRPNPTNGGLPDARGPKGGTLADLNDQLKVYLCDEKGNQLRVLPITNTISSVDPPQQGGAARSRKFVLIATEGTDYPRGIDYAGTKGILEDVVAAAVDPLNDDFPSDVRGYEGVDAIVWMDADAKVLTEGTNRSLDAIREWVRQGGQLVICEPDEPFKLEKFADLLPVQADPTSNAFSLRMERRADTSVFQVIVDRGHEDFLQKSQWNFKAPGVLVARAMPTSDAVVDEWIDWTTTSPGLPKRTPWLARRAYGLGCVTWVAQNLGNKALTGYLRPGWPVIWDRVFGWPNYTEGENPAQDTQDLIDKQFPDSESSVDLGSGLLNEMNLASKTAYLIGIAVFFFCVYWFVAGPGSYFILLQRKRANLSWFAFGFCAVVATLITVLLVKLVVRGPPVLKHLTMIRIPDDRSPAVATSELGLYIPRDGARDIALANTDPRPVGGGYIAPFPINPQYTQEKDTQFPSYQEYQVEIHDGSQPVDVKIPYRSTLKELQAKWVGPAPVGIQISPGNAPAIVDSTKGRLTGKLINRTGRDLRQVFIAFRYPAPATDTAGLSAVDSYYLIWLNHWDKESSVDLSAVMKRENRLVYATDASHVPSNDTSVVWAEIGANSGTYGTWADFWYTMLRADSAQGQDLHNPLTGAMLGFFDLLPPMMISGSADHRYELYHRGGRFMDVCSPVIAGKMVVLGQSESGPLPYTLEVDGDAIGGDGTTFYQCVLPLDRSALYPPATQPAQ